MTFIFKMLLLTGVIAALCLPGYCEYYQYKDDDGVLRFTDDISTVPASQRPGVQINPSVNSDAASFLEVGEEQQNIIAQKDLSAAEPALSGKGWERDVQQQIDELNRMDLSLRKTYTSLQTERSLLEEKEPSRRDAKQKWDAYRSEVKALNNKIEAYEEQVAVYEQKKKFLEERFAN
jgi:hypothetical protein